MSVINNLGELKSGHHAGLDLKEVWAGGEKVWSTARQFSIAGPVRFTHGWGSTWEVSKPVMGDLSILTSNPTSNTYPRGNTYVSFSVPVTCDRQVLYRGEVQEPGTILSTLIQPHLDRSLGMTDSYYFTFTEVT